MPYLDVDSLFRVFPERFAGFVGVCIILAFAIFWLAVAILCFRITKLTLKAILDDFITWRKLKRELVEKEDPKTD